MYLGGGWQLIWYCSVCWRAVKNQKKISEQITDELKRLADEENKKGQKRKAAEIEEDKSALAAPESFTTKAKSPSPQAHTGTTASTGAESSTKLRNKTDSESRDSDSKPSAEYPCFNNQATLSKANAKPTHGSISSTLTRGKPSRKTERPRTGSPNSSVHLTVSARRSRVEKARTRRTCEYNH